MLTLIITLFIIALIVIILMSDVQIIKTTSNDGLTQDDWELILQTLNHRYEYLSSLTFHEISVDEITEYENLENLIKTCQNYHSKISLSK